MLTERDLDSAVGEIRGFYAIASNGSWLLAKKLAEVEVLGLWKLRVDMHGVRVHKSFGDFAKNEIGFTPRYCRDLIRIALKFSEEEFRRLGPTKLRIVQQADCDAEHARRLARFKDGAGLRRVESEIGRAPRSQGASLVREHMRGGSVTLDLKEEESRAFRVSPVGDLLKLSKILLAVHRRRTRSHKASRRDVAAE